MSWKDAKQRAADWLQELQLPENLTGQTIDLVTLGTKLECEGTYRQMVLRAAGRELRQRGAKIKN
jgi:hypothetical protein